MRHSTIVAVAALALAWTSAAPALDYPTRPVRVIVGFAAGSGPDVLARTLSA